MGLVDVAIEGYRQVLERDAHATPQALAALERLGQATRSTSSTIADLLEPLYRHIGDWQKLIGVHEVQVRRSEDVDAPGRAAPPDRAALRGRRAAISAPRSPRSRAPSKEDPANEATQQQLDRVARATGRFADLARVFEELAGADRRSDARERALHDERARSRRTTSATSTPPIAPLPQGARDRSAEPRRRRVARAPLPRVRALPGAVASSCSASRRSSRSRSTRRTRSSRPPPSRRTSSNRPEAAIAVYSKVLEIDARRPARHRRARSGATSISRAGTTCSRVYAKKADLVADVDEKKGIYYQVGAVYERELGDVAARDRHVQRRSSSSIRTTCRRSRASTSSTSRRRTGRSSSPCSRARAR